MLSRIDNLILETKKLSKVDEVSGEKIKEKIVLESNFENAPKWIREMPTNLKTTWLALTESEKTNIYKRANLHILENTSSIHDFWK